MKRNLLLLFLLGFLCITAKAQSNTDTPNLSFEKGSFEKWERYTSHFYYDPIADAFNFGTWTPILSASSRFLIGSNTNDPIVYCDLINSPLNSNAVRIGEPRKTELSGSDKIGAASEKLIYRFKVTPNTTLLSYKLAAVLRAPDDGKHAGDQRPNIQMDAQVKDGNGNLYFLPCSSYSAKADYANPQLLKNKTKLQCPSSSVSVPDEYVYQPWLSGNINLSQHIGDSVIITIINHDCLYDYGPPAGVKGGTHESYGYFWAETKKIELTTFSCENSDASIVAPLGFSTYNWTRSDGKPMLVTNPAQPNIVTVDKSLNLEGVIYSCEMVDATSNCGAITSSTAITPVKLLPDFTNVAVDAGKIQFTSNSTSQGDTISDYYWDFGDGSYSALKNPLHTYVAFNPFTVKLTVTSSKGCSKTISHNVLPTKELTAAIFPPANLGYNGQTKDFTSTTNIAGLQVNIDYYIRYRNRLGTSFYNSYTAPTTVGDYTATFELSYLSLLKYFINSIPSQDFSIAKAPLIVTAKNISKVYGEKITLLRDAFTQDMKPLYAGDKIYELELLCNGLSDTASVGLYSILPTKAIGLGVENYDIQFVAGNLNVNPKLIKINALDQYKVYGDQLNSSGREFYVSNGSFVGDDSISSISVQCVGFNSLSQVGSYPIVATAAVGVRLSNYTISYTNAVLVVKKKTIAVAAKPLSKVYGETAVFSGKEYITDLTQFIGNDSVSNVQLASVGADKKALAGNYNLLLTAVSGHNLTNYDINFVNSTYKVIPLSITVTPKNKVKEYGDLLAFSGSEFITDKPFVAGDTILYVSLKSSGGIETAPIGNYDILASSAYGTGMLNYDIVYNLGQLGVTKKKLIAALYPPASMSYNGSPKEFTATVNVSGLLQNSDYYIRYINKQGTPAYNSITAPSAVGEYTASFELNSSSLLKYDLATLPTQDFAITKVALTITTDDVVKTYGDKLNLVKNAFKPDLKPLFGNDKIYELELSSVGATDTASIGNYPIIATKAIGIGLENYDIHFVAGKLTVYPKSLILKAIDVFKTYGENINPNEKGFYVDPNYLVANDTVFIVSSKSNGFLQNALVGIYPIKISEAVGRRLSNYLISYFDGTLQVTKKKINITPLAFSKAYGTTHAFTSKEFYTDFSQMVGNDTILSVQLTSQGVLSQSQIGEYSVGITAVSGTGLDNYEIKLLTNTLKVTPMAITIIANDLTKPYGSLLTLDGSEFKTNKPLLNGDEISFVVLKSSGCSETAPVGDYDIFSLSAYGLGAINYDFSYEAGKLSVVKKALTAQLVAPAYLVYDAQNKEFNAVVNIPAFVKNTDYFIRYTNRTGTSFYNSFTAPFTVGDYTATFEMSNLSMLKYSIASVPSIDFSITKAPLNITAENTTKTYGEKLTLKKDAFKVDVKPLFGGDIIFEANFECKGLIDTASVNDYQITPNKLIGTGLENYDIHFIAGTLTVQPKQLIIRAVDVSKIYGEELTPDPTIFYVDTRELIGTDKVTSVQLTSLGYSRFTKVGSYQIKPSGAVGSGLNNYQLSYADANFSIYKKKITVTAKTISKVYGGDYVFRSDEFETDATQFVGTDKIAGVKLNSQGAQKIASVGEYTLLITAAVGQGIENYDIKMQNGLFIVTQMPIIVIANNIVKEFGDVLSFSSNEFTTNIPLVNNDTISFAFLKSIGINESAPIGEYDIIPSQAFGLGSLNYSISYGVGKLKVVRKILQVIAQNCMKEYGENDPEKKFVVIDKRGVEYQPSMFSGNISREPGEKVGEYAITKGTLSISPSYSYGFIEAKLVIRKALPTIDPSFTNNNGQYIVADVIGSKNGDKPQGNICIRIKQLGIDNTISVLNGESKCLISALPNHMVEAELNYLGDDNYLASTKTIKIYAIIYHCNGGALASPITNFDGSESVKLESPIQNNNYKFEGWYENEDFSGIQIRRIALSTYHDVHLYAKWFVTYDDLSIVTLFNQVLAVANPLNREFLYKSTFKWFRDDVLLTSSKQYCGFDNYVPTGIYKVEIYYLNNAAIVLELNHTASIQKSKIYPNPLKRNSELTLCSNLVEFKGLTVEVYNMLGVLQTKVLVKQNGEKLMFNGFDNAGVYVIRLLQDGTIKETHKVIVEE